MSLVPSDESTGRVPGRDPKVEDVVITCPPLHPHPERNWSAEPGWQTMLRSVPVVLPVASAATPAERSLPAAAGPAGSRSTDQPTHGCARLGAF